MIKRKIFLFVFFTLLSTGCSGDDSKVVQTPVADVLQPATIVGSSPVSIKTPPTVIDPVETPSPYPGDAETVIVPTDMPLPGVEEYTPPTSYQGVSPMAEGITIFNYQVVNMFPHDRGSYIQGLIVDDNEGFLLEGTGLWGKSSLRRVDLETGEVIQYLALPEQYFGEGITVFDNRIIQLTWKSGLGFVYDRESFTMLDIFRFPHEGWGITHDGQQLIVSDGTATLHFWDPQTMTETSQIQVTDECGPVGQLNELEYVDGEILANIWLTDRIARISPETGQVVGWIDLTGLLAAEDRDGTEDVLNGIAYDPTTTRLFVTGKRWPWLYEIELVAGPVQSLGYPSPGCSFP